MNTKYCLVLFCCTCLVACGGKKTVKSNPAPPVVTKPATAPTAAPVPEPTPQPTTNPSAAEQKPATEEATKPGGYYLDDGPGENPPQNIENIPNAVPKKETLNPRTNKPYRALGQVYTPMKGYQPYKEQGVASWYGKRFHGKKTASGENYDMYSMTAAHTTLPLPSYAKVTNPANGKSVIVRVNDRGPFKHSRIIDLSFAAAHKLGYTNKGSTLVEVEAIDPDKANSYVETKSVAVEKSAQKAVATTTSNVTLTTGYFVQAGAFKNEANADALINKIQRLEIVENAGFNKVYNTGLHRVVIGPFEQKPDADKSAANIRKQLNVPAITINQTSNNN